MTITSKVTIRTKWLGNKRMNEIKSRLGRGAMQAAQLYKNELKKELSKEIGSEFVSANLRRRFKHSSPGEPPYFQTGNLAQSLKISTNFLTRGTIFSSSRHTISVRISSRVRYAVTLERGGALSVPEAEKTFTSIRLVNPLKSTPTITPRPAWTPVFDRLRPIMLKTIIQSTLKP
jgi:hypothetical protein